MHRFSRVSLLNYPLTRYLKIPTYACTTTLFITMTYLWTWKARYRGHRRRRQAELRGSIQTVPEAPAPLHSRSRICKVFPFTQQPFSWVRPKTRLASTLNSHRNADHPDEKNDMSRQLIRSKINRYLARADKLKQRLAGRRGEKSKPPEPTQSMGTGTVCQFCV